MLRACIPLVPALFLAAAAAAGAAGPSPAASLRAAHDELRQQLTGNPFGRPLHLDSREGSSELKGGIHAVVDHPFEMVKDALDDPAGWCDVLILQFNTKRCEALDGDPQGLALNIGRKHDQPLEKTVRVEFPFRVTAATEDYFSVILYASSGPYGTKDYRIRLEAVPLENGRSFLHLSYSYGFGVPARLAMQTYLATTGRSKPGFTIVDKEADGDPVYVGGVRGMVERNTMRYYLAIETCLDSLTAPAEARVEKRLNDWFAAIERYPRQLHEMERETYLTMKRREIRRQKG